jgi:hypothetical protein
MDEGREEEMTSPVISDGPFGYSCIKGYAEPDVFC